MKHLGTTLYPLSIYIHGIRLFRKFFIFSDFYTTITGNATTKEDLEEKEEEEEEEEEEERVKRNTNM